LVGALLERLTVGTDEALGKRPRGERAEVVGLQRLEERMTDPRGACQFLEGNASLLT
jgi:hypothetical protein